MNSNEEYLDNLLKTMSESSDKNENNSNAIMSAEEIEAMFAAAEKVAGSEMGTVEETNINNDDMIDFENEEPIDETDVPKAEAEPEMENSEIAELLEALPEITEPEMNDSEIAELLNAEPESVELEGTEVLDSAQVNDEITENDLDVLLKNLDENDDLSEINELLKKADNNESVLDDSKEEASDFDEMAEGGAEAILNEDNEDLNANDSKQKKVKEKKEKKEKEKKEKKKKKDRQNTKTDTQDIVSDENNKEKKKGFFGRLISALVTEDDSESTANENQSIMDELEAEDQKEANKKKKIKKGKSLENSSGQEEGIEENTNSSKKKQKKAPKVKPQKEKKPKKVKPEPVEEPSRKISRKSIFVVVLFSLSVFTALLLGIYLGATMIQSNNAIKAFEKQDYLTCYEQLYGMNLSEKQATMFHHAEVVLKTQRRIDMYEKYLEDDKELEAIDSLMQLLFDYEGLYADAQSYKATEEVSAIYDEVIDLLKEKYGLTEDDAMTIAKCPNNIEYTRYLVALKDGIKVSGDENTEGIVLPKSEKEDILPAEEEIEEPIFSN